MDGSVKNLLEAEREAQKIITAAQSEREAKYENAKTQAMIKINQVQQNLDRKIQDQLANLEGKEAAVRQEQSRVQEEINQIESQFNKNKDSVIDMLLTGVMHVQLDVPRVVKVNYVVAAEEWD